MQYACAFGFERFFVVFVEQTAMQAEHSGDALILICWLLLLLCSFARFSWFVFYFVGCLCATNAGDQLSNLSACQLTNNQASLQMSPVLLSPAASGLSSRCSQQPIVPDPSRPSRKARCSHPCPRWKRPPGRSRDQLQRNTWHADCARLGDR